MACCGDAYQLSEIDELKQRGLITEIRFSVMCGGWTYEKAVKWMRLNGFPIKNVISPVIGKMIICYRFLVEKPFCDDQYTQVIFLREQRNKDVSVVML
jgi:hypothetical protein